MFDMTESYFTLSELLPSDNGSKKGEGNCLTSTFTDKLGQKESLHVCGLEAEELGHQNVRKVGYRALLNNTFCFIREQC